MHLCRFDTTGDLPAKERRDYATVKAAVLAAGRFSVFEASETPTSRRLFTRLEHDPELELILDPAYAYPWTGVRKKETRHV